MHLTSTSRQTNHPAPRLKVASVGLGWVTTHRHLRVMDRSPHYEVVGVIDRRPGRAAEVAKQHRYNHFYEGDSLENVPWLDRVDAVTVGSCPMSHYGLIESALRLGKHVLTEKPFVMTVGEGENAVKIAQDLKLVLAIVHNFQFASSTQQLLRDIQQGRLGSVKAIIAQQFSNPRRRLPNWYDQLPLGLFYDESPHFFYLIRRLAPGPLTFLRADVAPSSLGLQTPATLAVHYKCDVSPSETVPVLVTMNFEAPVSEWHLTVYGDRCLGSIDIFRDIYIRLPNDGLHTTGTVVRTSVLATWQHWSQHFTSGLQHLAGNLFYGNETVFERFATAVLQNKPPNDIHAEDALDVLRMQHLVLENQNHLY